MIKIFLIRLIFAVFFLITVILLLDIIIFISTGKSILE